MSFVLFLFRIIQKVDSCNPNIFKFIESMLLFQFYYECFFSLQIEYDGKKII